MRELESTQRVFTECLADDNLRANLIEEFGTVFVEVLCIVDGSGCVTSRDEEESFRRENKVSQKRNGSVCPASVSSGP